MAKKSKRASRASKGAAGSRKARNAPPPPPSQNVQERRRSAVVADSAAAGQIAIDQKKQLRIDMMRSVVTEPLLSRVQQDLKGIFDVIIVVNELFEHGVDAAIREIERQADAWGASCRTTPHYCFVCLTGQQILDLADDTRERTRKHGRGGALVYRIWEDSEVAVTLTKSLVTVKADAAQRAFAAQGQNVLWAVLDSGVQHDHPHFERPVSPFGPINTLDCPAPVVHRDYTPDGRDRNPPDEDGKPLVPHQTAIEDRLGHGTHVAGIIAGYWESKNPDGEPVAGAEVRDELSDQPVLTRDNLQRTSGVAPLCKIVSLKVIADQTLTIGTAKQSAGQGKVSWILLAIEQIQKWNQWGKRVLVHGVNMSLGYDFDPRWFGCGHSPLCVEVNRLVRCGVNVVVSAGNSGYPTFVTASGKAESRFSDVSITDPGNADLAVTVGSTHRDMPHTYGVSYFSSRGPTGDGRLKPDLLAPGERIISCAAGAEAAKFAAPATGTPTDGKPVLYCEQSGTSMAAPHVSGAIAAFVSVRPEFVGQPERIKALLMASAVDLGRERPFQGAGLLDVMKLLQTV